MLAREPGDTNAPFREGKNVFRREWAQKKAPGRGPSAERVGGRAYFATSVPFISI